MLAYCRGAPSGLIFDMSRFVFSHQFQRERAVEVWGNLEPSARRSVAQCKNDDAAGRLSSREVDLGVINYLARIGADMGAASKYGKCAAWLPAQALPVPEVRPQNPKP